MLEETFFRGTGRVEGESRRQSPMGESKMLSAFLRTLSAAQNRTARARSLMQRRSLVEGQIQLQDVNPRLAQNTESAALSMSGHQFSQPLRAQRTR